MKWIRTGATREVLLTRKFAFKFPKITHSWRNFLWGLLANMQEADFSSTGDKRLCPVIFSLPLGLLVVMPRANVLSDAEFGAIRFNCYSDLPVEKKASSFALLGRRIVAIDYAGPGRTPPATS